MKVLCYTENGSTDTYNDIRHAAFELMPRIKFPRINIERVKEGIAEAIGTGEEFPPLSGITWDILEDIK